MEIYGTVVLEGGSVIKSSLYTASSPKLWIRGTLDCQTSPYNTAIFTASDDDTVGETISGSTGIPSTTSFYSWYNLMVLTAGTSVVAEVHDIRSMYSWNAVAFSRAGESNYVWNLQAYRCDRGVETVQSGAAVRNALMHKVGFALSASSVESGNTITAEHVTVNEAKQLFWYGTTVTNSLNITNSIVCTVTNDTTAGIYSNYVSVLAASDFQTVGDGRHYLAVGSAYRDAGTSNISPEASALNILRTTYPPLFLTNDFTTSQTLEPVVARDTNAPDLGYHYALVDYMWKNLNLTNSTLLLTNGVVVASQTNQIFLQLRNAGFFVSEGSPLAPNRMVRSGTVQELANVNTSIWLYFMDASATPAGLNMRFTEVTTHAGGNQERRLVDVDYNGDSRGFSIAHSELHNGVLYVGMTLGGTGISATLTNNVLRRIDLDVETSFSYTPPTLSFRNNLFQHGSLDLNAPSSVTTTPSWTVKDNLIDATTLTKDFSGYPAITNNISHNGYTGSLASLGGTNNVTGLTADFVSGTLGDYYYPSSGTNLLALVNAGSRASDTAGLYHFTTQTTEAKETTSTVDIGFHYVALENGVPADWDSDGVLDYLEDTDGDGVVDANETDWLNPNLNVWISRPANNSILP